MSENASEKLIRIQVSPESSLELLSVHEMKWLIEQAHTKQHDMLRRCVLAVLNSGVEQDDAEAVLQQFKDFDVRLSWQRRGIRFDLTNPPPAAFVDGKMIRGIREHLSSVVRDLIYAQRLLYSSEAFDLPVGQCISDFVFQMLRNADVLIPSRRPNLVVCWGGHAISQEEYEYSKEVGYQLGLRELDICTGCGPGAMKGPMKGATIAHAKQRVKDALYLGITEPGIIASESPNPIVNHLVILPDIEKRLEAFVRIAHGIVVFPGGVGTAEEILYLLGILMHPDNGDIPLPVVLSGPASAREYFAEVDQFIRTTLGEDAASRYQIVVDDPVKTAQLIAAGIEQVYEFRTQNHDSYHFNWRLNISSEWQQPFAPTHENMAELNLDQNQPAHELAINLRRAFSGIVAGNVKPDGVRAIREKGPFRLQGSQTITEPLDRLLSQFVAQKRMTLAHDRYRPCYQIEKA